MINSIAKYIYILLYTFASVQNTMQLIVNCVLSFNRHSSLFKIHVSIFPQSCLICLMDFQSPPLSGPNLQFLIEHNHITLYGLVDEFRMFASIFNNISVISQWSFAQISETVSPLKKSPDVTYKLSHKGMQKTCRHRSSDRH